MVQQREDGFVVPADGGEDLFAHFSAVVIDGYKTLSEGDRVKFDITLSDKDPQATNIIIFAVAPGPAADISTESSTKERSTGKRRQENLP